MNQMGPHFVPKISQVIISLLHSSYAVVVADENLNAVTNYYSIGIFVLSCCYQLLLY
jgi:hypothetical protein